MILMAFVSKKHILNDLSTDDWTYMAEMRNIWKYLPSETDIQTNHRTLFSFDIFGLEYVLRHFVMVLVEF